MVVAAPERDALREASYFVERLGDGGDAARRAGPQPGAPHRREVAVGRAGAGRRGDPGEERRATRWRPACCGCTRSGCGSSSGSSRCAAGSPPRTRGCRWSTCPAQPGDVHDLAGLRTDRRRPRRRLTGRRRRGDDRRTAVRGGPPLQDRPDRPHRSGTRARRRLAASTTWPPEESWCSGRARTRPAPSRAGAATR